MIQIYPEAQFKVRQGIIELDVFFCSLNFNDESLWEVSRQNLLRLAIEFLCVLLAIQLGSLG